MSSSNVRSPTPSVPTRVPPVAHRSTFAGLGTFALRELLLPDDVPFVHAWVNGSHASYWGMQGWSHSEVEAGYRSIVEPQHVDAYLGLHETRPTFLVETYSAVEDRIAEHYDARPTDRGMHVLVAPLSQRVGGFTWAVFRTVMDFLFADPRVERVVVEPDVRNTKIQALNARAGFVPIRTVTLAETPTVPGKTGLLSICERRAYANARDAEVSP